MILIGWDLLGTMSVMHLIISKHFMNGQLILIRAGKAYVDSQTSEDIANQKGTPTQAWSK